MHPVLIAPIVLLILYGTIWRANTTLYGRVIVFKSKWFHGYRYTIRVTEHNQLRVVLWKREFWAREIIESGKIDTGTMIEMYKSAHELGQNYLKIRTQHLINKNIMIKFGKEYAKKMSEVVTVSTKLDII